MAPKNRNVSANVSAEAAVPTSGFPSAAGSPRKPQTSSSKGSNEAQDIVMGIWNNYMDKTPQRTKLIDIFMAFLVVVGAVQFVYCVLFGNYVRLAQSFLIEQ